METNNFKVIPEKLKGKTLVDVAYYCHGMMLSPN